MCAVPCDQACCGHFHRPGGTFSLLGEQLSETSESPPPVHPVSPIVSSQPQHKGAAGGRRQKTPDHTGQPCLPARPLESSLQRGRLHCTTALCSEPLAFGVSTYIYFYFGSKCQGATPINTKSDSSALSGSQHKRKPEREPRLTFQHLHVSLYLKSGH